MENTTTKMTKMERFQALKTFVENSTSEMKNEFIELIDGEIEAIERRKAAAKVRAEQKKAESDALTDAIYACMTDDAQTVEDILENVDFEDVTRNKITARIGKLIKAGLVMKQTIKVDGSRKMAYCKADAVAADA